MFVIACHLFPRGRAHRDQIDTPRNYPPRRGSSRRGPQRTRTPSVSEVNRIPSHSANPRTRQQPTWIVEVIMVVIVITIISIAIIMTFMTVSHDGFILPSKWRNTEASGPVVVMSQVNRSSAPFHRLPQGPVTFVHRRVMGMVRGLSLQFWPREG